MATSTHKNHDNQDFLQDKCLNFFSHISHEFRTPISLILSSLNELISQTTNPIELKKLELIKRNSLRVLKLANSLLDFKSTEAVHEPFYQPVNLSNLTTDITSIFQSTFEQAGLELKIDIQELPKEVTIDPDIWEKILLNLISNSLKFTFHGKISVRLRVCRNNNAIQLCVEDTGVGIAEEDLPHIFVPFYKMNTSHGRTQEGAGIGLSLVKKLLSLHKGRIWVKSKVGSGSRFYVQIPLDLPPSQAAKNNRVLSVAGKHNTRDLFVNEASQWIPEQLTSHINSPLHQKRIVVADDNADMRHYLQSVLQEYWQVEIVTNGEEAYDSIVNNPPYMLLADVLMPKLDGLSLAYRLRSSSNPSVSSIPIVLLSAKTGEDACIDGLLAGADDYLVKPFSTKELIARIGSHLELKHLRLADRKRTDQLYATFMQAPVGITVFEGPDHICKLTNLYAEKFFGDRTLLDKPLREALPELIIQPQSISSNECTYLDLIDNVYKSGKSVVSNEVKIIYTHSDGSLGNLYFNVLCQPKFNINDTIDGVFVIFTNVTDHVLSQQQIVVAEQRLKMAFKSAGLATWEYNANKKLLLWDEYAQTVMNVAAMMKAADFDSFTHIIHPDDIHRFMSKIHCSINDGIDFDDEFCITSHDKLRWIRLIAKVFKDEHNVVERVIGIVVDITNKHINLLNLRDAIKARDDFLSVASHELKTSITPLKLQIQLARRKITPTTISLTPERLIKFLDISADQLERLNFLIDDLFDISKIQSHQLELHLEPTCLNKLSHQIVEQFANELEETQMPVTIDIPDNCVGYWDKPRIEQVIINLLSNAIKYAAGKPVHITATKQHNNWVEYVIRDFGPGISKDIQDSIFDRFERANSCKNIEGLGLGLFIVKKIVEHHKGEIYVKSELGQGARFIIRLPINPNRIIN